MTYGKKLPIGVENFEKLIQEDFYYVDKTELITDLLKNWGEVNLFTRPRRFGKSLNMSMLKTFFEIGCDKKLFQGLKISEEKELCEKYMGQFPVISVSLKGGEGRSFEIAKEALKRVDVLHFFQTEKTCQKKTRRPMSGLLKSVEKLEMAESMQCRRMCWCQAF